MLYQRLLVYGISIYMRFLVNAVTSCMCVYVVDLYGANASAVRISSESDWRVNVVSTSVLLYRLLICLRSLLLVIQFQC